MNSFNIDIEALDWVQYAEGASSFAARITLAKDATPGTATSELRMSVHTARLLHQGLAKVLKSLDEHGPEVKVTTVPSLPRATPKAP